MPRNTVEVRILAWRAGGPAPPESTDLVAAEEPLELRVAGRPVSITMRTPGQDEELACGFLLGEGVIRRAADVMHVRQCTQGPGDAVEVMLAEGVLEDPDRLMRRTYVSSSCGICGASSIDAVRRRFPALGPGPVVSAEVLLSLPDRLRVDQPGFEASGGLHAAGLFTSTGERLAVREDVGRHNAVDKVLGWALRGGRVPLSNHVLVVSGRASFELVQKAVAAGVPHLCAVSAPSSLAVDLAVESGLTLVGFLRPGRFNLYAHPERVAMSPRAATPGPG